MSSFKPVKQDVLVVDDEIGTRDMLKETLKASGYDCRLAYDSTSAFKLISEHVPSVIILDIWLQGSELDGIGILQKIKKKHPHLPVIIITAHGTIDLAVKAINEGAYDFIEKPFGADKLLISVQRAYENSKLLKENSELRQKTLSTVKELVGCSPFISQMRSLIEKVAPTESRILMTGDVGTGKAAVARLIHQKSRRNNNNFVIFNPRDLSDEQQGNELFGFVEYSKHQEPSRKRGLLEKTDNGTLYIAEINELGANTQSKLVKYLNEMSKSDKEPYFKSDVRIISATIGDLSGQIKAGKFRQDLYNRLNVVPMHLLPLSERRDDIPLLCEHFLKQLSKLPAFSKHEMGDDALIALQNYNWPGNVRQLYNIIEWMVILSESKGKKKLDLSMLHSEITQKAKSPIPKLGTDITDIMSMPIREAREIFEKQYLTIQVNRFNGNISRTSSFVGMERSALHRKLKSLNIIPANTNNMANNNDEEIDLASSE